jgi:Flp pilus assembly pilin Flp
VNSGLDPGKEENMTALMMRLVADDAGQDLAEYGIALAVIGTIAAAAAIVIAKDVGTLWSKAQNVIDSAAS